MSTDRGGLAAFGLVLVFAVIFIAGISPWRSETCEVTGRASSALTASKGQQWDYIETTCGDLGASRRPGRGHDILEQVEVGKTYRFGLNGFGPGWTRPNIITFEEVSN